MAEAVINSLRLIFHENKFADKVIEKTLRQNPRWGARDRRFIAETTYDIVRWKRLYQEVGRARDEDYWKWFAVWIIQHEFQYPDWHEFDGINVRQIRMGLAADFPLSIKESIPDWLDQLGVDELNDRWPSELKALNE